MTIDRIRINGNDLSFSLNGDLIHKEYGKLGHSTDIESWDLIVSRLSFITNERPYLLSLVKGVWDTLPLPPLFGAEYILDKKHNRCSSLISLSAPYESDTLYVGEYGVIYIRVNTPKPFHFWNEESVALSNVWALIDTHKEQVKDTLYE